MKTSLHSLVVSPVAKSTSVRSGGILPLLLANWRGALEVGLAGEGDRLNDIATCRTESVLLFVLVDPSIATLRQPRRRDSRSIDRRQGPCWRENWSINDGA